MPKKIKPHFYSRLRQKERVKNYRRIFIFTTLTLLLMVFILSGGLTTLVNFAFLVGQPAQPPASPTKTPIYLSPPLLSPLPSATNSASIEIIGFAQKDNKVEIFLNDQSSAQTKTQAGGQFTAKLNLTEGENEIYGIAQDLLGNASSPSDKQRIIFDDEPPELVIDQPASEEKFVGQKNQSIQIRGLTEPGAQLYLNDHLIILDSKGNFSTTWKLAQGENLLKFRAKDLAENETEKELPVFFQL